MKNILILSFVLGVLSFFSVSFLAQATDSPAAPPTEALHEETITVIEEISDSDNLTATCREAVDASFSGEAPSPEEEAEALRLCIDAMRMEPAE